MDINGKTIYDRDLPFADERVGVGEKCDARFEDTETKCNKVGMCVSGERHRGIYRDGVLRGMIYWDIENEGE
jgi:hypothetical protein